MATDWINKYEISAGIVPIDNSSGAEAMSYYISAGLVPDDTALVGWIHKWDGVDGVNIATID